MKTLQKVQTILLCCAGLIAAWATEAAEAKVKNGTPPAKSTESSQFYRLESALTIKSPNPPNWDHITFDAAHNLLYIARREDGILIYDTVGRRLKGDVANTAGANAVTLVPELDRGFVTNEDGSLTTFQLATQKVLGRASVGKSADNSFYDPATSQLLVAMGDDSLVTFVDARTGKVNGTLHLNSHSIEGAVSDGRGNYFVALRDRDTVVKLDARTRKLVAQFRIAGCVQPNSMAFDAANQRVLVGCRGAYPILAVLDTSGRTLGSAEIGRGVDTIVFDPAAKRVYTANGVDASLTILDQVTANTYTLAQAPTTRPYARTLALDPKSHTIYLVCAEGTVDPSHKWKTGVAPFYPNKYFLNTFTLLTYSQR